METNVTSGDVNASPARSSPGDVADARGRKFTVKLLDPLETYRLARAMGPTADVDVARTYASYAASVRVIDGEPQAFPNSDRDIQSMLQLLGTDGIEAVQKAILQIGEAASPAGNAGAVKN